MTDEKIELPATHLEATVPFDSVTIDVVQKEMYVNVRIRCDGVNQVLLLDEEQAREFAEELGATAEEIEAEAVVDR